MFIKLLAGVVEYHPQFIPNHQDIFHKLFDEINWRQDEIKFYGKVHPIPRKHAWYADEGCFYSYSRIELPLNLWTPTLLKLKTQVERAVGMQFNGVLANLYMNGQDSNGWHSDDELELVRPINVASLSFGMTREMHFRRKGTTKISDKISLEPGSLLVMKNECQESWQHQIPKRMKVERPRINLTFRQVLKSP